MRILHTADWHLGKRLDSFSRIQEQREILQEICEIAEREKADAILVAGDLFDTFNPATEAIDLLYKTLKRLTNNGRRPVIAIAGNHDSPDRIESPDPLARECGIIFAGYPHSIVPVFRLDTGLEVLKSEEGFLELSIPGNEAPLRILLTPYANEYRLKTYLGMENSEAEMRTVLQQRWQELVHRHCDERGVNILISHIFMIQKGAALPEEPEEEKPILHVGGAQAVYTENIPTGVQYTALGHLHRMRQVSATPCPVYYSGSPLSYSFSEANQKKHVLMVDVNPGEEATVQAIELTQRRPLLRKRSEGIEEALQWLSENPDALVELTLVTDTYLTAREQRALHTAHPGIVALIPEVNTADPSIGSTPHRVDLDQDIVSLFSDYFKHEKGQEPNEEIIQLFTEILAEEEDQ